MKNNPTVAMNPTAKNLRTVVATCTDPMFLTPERLKNAAPHSPASTRRTEIHLVWSVLMNCSTYRTQPTAIAAFPAHAVIQYDQAFANPYRFPYATRTYA